MFVLILAIFLSSIFLPVLGTINRDNGLSTSTTYDKVYKGFLYKKESLEAMGGGDAYKLALKAGKLYYFSIKIDSGLGLQFFVTVMGNPGDAYVGTWGSGDPEDMRKIEFTYTPAVDSNQTLLITKILPIDMVENEYTVYVNRNGFAGIWWMILAGIGALALIILVIALIIRAARPKKKSKRKK